MAAEDDGGTTDDAGAGPRTHRVFASSTVHDGALGGPSGADDVCNARAQEADLEGTYVAWVSTADVDARDRLDVEDDARFERTDGTALAESVADLLDGDLLAPIAVDEAGRAVRGDVWTGTLSDGTAEADLHCDGFTTANESAGGVCGSTGAADGRWTVTQVPACSVRLRLYCFEL